jgi:hypothetical protein
VAALAELRKLQAAEAEKAEDAHGAGPEDLDWYTAGDQYLVTRGKPKGHLSHLR